MNSQGFKDMRDGAIGFLAAIGLFCACAIIVLGLLGYFDQGIHYRYPTCQPDSIQAMLLPCDQRAAKDGR